MMKLTEKGIGRQYAHEIVREASMVAVEKEIHLRDALLQRADIKKYLTEDEIKEVMDASNYIGSSKEITDKMVSAVEDIIGKRV